MVDFECPWCEDVQLVEPATLHADTTFDCPTCGTRVEFVDETEQKLELAA